MPGLYGYSGNANVAVGNTVGLYQQNTGVTQVLSSPQLLLSLLSNASTVGFSLTTAGTQVQGTVLPSGVTAGTYGDSTYVPQFNISADGRIVSVANVQIPGVGPSSYGNANVAAYLASGTDATINSINANIAGANAAQITANTIQSNQINALTSGLTAANAAIVTANTIQSNQIQTLSANLGAFEAYANATFGTGNYSNVNVAAYLTTATINTTGNVTAGNLISNNFLYPNGVSILSGINGNYSNVNVAAYLTTATINTTGNVTANVVTGNNIVASTNVSAVNANISGTAYVNAIKPYSGHNVVTSVGSGGPSAVLNVGANPGAGSSVSVSVIGDTGTPSIQLQASPAGVGYAGGDILIQSNPNPSSPGSPAAKGNIKLESSFLNITSSTSTKITGPVESAGNITALSGAYFIGDGSLLTNLPAGNYGNANVAAYLPTYTGVFGVGGAGSPTVNASVVNLITGSPTAPYNTVNTGNIKISDGAIVGGGSSLLGVANLTLTGGSSTPSGILVTGTGGTVTASGNITAPYFVGDGSALTNIVTKLVAGANIALSPAGGQGQVTISTIGGTAPNTSTGYYGSFYDTTNQYANVATTAYTVGINSTVGTNGVSLINGNAMSFSNSGVYNVNFSIQFVNTDNAQHEANVWLVQNGTPLSYTNSQVTIPARANPATPGASLMTVPFVITVVAGDTVQLAWQQDSGTSAVYIASLTSGTSPTRPAIPGVVLNATQVTSVTGNQYGDSNVATFLGSNFGSNTITTTGNITAGNLIATSFVQGDGSKLTNLPVQPGTYSNANVASYLPVYNGSIGSTGNVMNNINSGGTITLAPNATSSSTPTVAMSGSAYSAVQGSTGSFITLTTVGGNIFAGTASGNTSIASGAVTTSGALTAGNVITTNGVFWANGTAYSSGSGAGVTSITAGTGITANASTGAVSITNAGVTSLTAGSGISLSGSTGAITITNTGGGSGSFSGNLLGNTLVDTTNYRVTINASPYSDPGVTPLLWQNMKNNPPTYVGGVLQPPLGLTNVAAIDNSSYLMFTTSNVGMQSSYQTTTTRFSQGILNYQSVWPVTANIMTNSDRVRHTNNILEINMNGKSWGTNLGQTNAVIGNNQNFLNIYGNGSVLSTSGISAVTYLTPIGTAAGSGLSANLTYATGVTGSFQTQATYGATYTANVTTARGFMPVIAIANNNHVVTTAIGLHTPGGWVNTPGTAGGGSIANRYAILNEDQYSAIQTNGNLILTPGSSNTGLKLGGWYSPNKNYTTGVASITLGPNNNQQPFQQILLSQNLTINYSAGGIDTVYDFSFQQDGTGGRTVTWTQPGGGSYVPTGLLNPAPSAVTYARVILSDTGYFTVSYSWAGAAAVTATVARATAGAAGNMLAITDNGGRLAYYDTTNSRWSYVFDNSAV